MEPIATDERDSSVVPKKRDIHAAAEDTSPARLTSIFTIDNNSYDVVLNDEKLAWASLSGKNKCPKVKKSRSRNLIRRLSLGSSRENLNTETEHSNCIFLRDVLAVRIKRLRRAHQGEGEGVCQGMALVYAERKENMRLKTRMMVLGNPSQIICEPWILKIKKVLETFTARPKTLHIFLQPYAGNGRAKDVYKERIRPLLDFSGVKAEVTELQHNEHVKQDMVHLELDHYDSIVCIGGDGTVNQVLNGLIQRTMTYEGVKLSPGITPPQPPLPLGIVPAGTINTIAHSIMGNEDPMTAIIHIMMGHTRPVNVCSMWEDDKLVRWGFNCHYGFYGDLLKASKKYNALGEKRIELAAMKILTSKKLRPYHCDIDFVLAQDKDGPTDGVVCKEGCDVCDSDGPDKLATASYSDNIENLDTVNSSNTSAQTPGLAKQLLWQSRQYSCLGVSIHSLAQRSPLAPFGMSKHTHSNDGLLDLVLMKYVNKKDFVRYLRRLGNHKNPFEFPFIETHRCKEIRIRITPGETSNGVQHEPTKKEERKKSATEEGKNTSRKSQQLEVVDILAESEDEDEGGRRTEEDYQAKGAYVNESLKADNHLCISPSPSLSKKLSNVRRSWGSEDCPADNEAEEENHDITPAVFQCPADGTASTHDPAAATADKHSRSVWNVDNDLLTQFDLSFRVHPSLVRIHGLGIPEQSDPDIVKMSCLSIFR